MRIVTIRVLLIAAFVLLLSGGQSVQAFVCMEGKVEPCQAYGKASAVFVGTVADVTKTKLKFGEGKNEYEYDQWLFTFHVEESFSGVSSAEAQVVTGQGDADCGYGFRRGASYLVYAYRNLRDERLHTGICSPTKPAAQATEELKFLRGLSSRDPGVTLSGALISAYPTKDNAKPPIDERVVGLSIIVEGEGERRELRTDAEGRYRLTGLKAGTYTIKVVLPDELYIRRTEEKVTIAQRGCGGIDFFVTDNGRISGRASDAEGQPVSRITVNALLAEEVEKDIPNMQYAQTDEEGNFKFEALPPGSYLLGVRLRKYSHQNDPMNAFPRMYHPGVEVASQAELVAVGKGEHVKDFALRLLPRRTPRRLRGEVVWADGRPVKNAHVRFGEVTYREDGMDNSISADEHGRFKLNAYEGLTYVFSASSNTRHTGTPEHAQPVRITVGEGRENVRIIIHPPTDKRNRAAAPPP